MFLVWGRGFVLLRKLGTALFPSPLLVQNRCLNRSRLSSYLLLKSEALHPKPLNPIDPKPQARNMNMS